MFAKDKGREGERWLVLCPVCAMHEAYRIRVEAEKAAAGHHHPNTRIVHIAAEPFDREPRRLPGSR